MGNRNQAGSAGSAVRAGGRCAGHGELWIVPGRAERTARPGRRNQRRWTRIGRPPADTDAQQPRRGSGRALDRAPARRGASDADIREARRRRSGIRSEESARCGRRVSTASECPGRGSAPFLSRGPRSGWLDPRRTVGCDLEWTTALRRHVERAGDPRDSGPRRSPRRLCSSAANAWSRRSACLWSRVVFSQGSTSSNRTTWRSSTRRSRRNISARTSRLDGRSGWRDWQHFPYPSADPTFEIIGVVRDFANQGPRELPDAAGAPPVHTARPGGVRVRGADIRRSDARGQRRPSGDSSGRPRRSRWSSPPPWKT